MRRSLALLTLTLALAGLPATAAHAADPLATGPVVVTSGVLDWGVKASFRSYVRGPIAHGDYVAGDGASENADGTLRFPALDGTYDATTGRTVARLGGSVRFTGHAGALDMTFSALRVELDGAGAGTLFADAVSKPNTPGSAPTASSGVALAALDAAAATVTRGDAAVGWTGIGATLTDAGAPAFAGFYGSGQALDPVDLSITTGGPAPADPPAQTPAPAPATTPPPAPVAPPAPAVTAAGTTPAPAAVVRRPAISAAPGRVRVGRTRTATVVTVRCLDGPCAVTAPRTTRARIGGRAATLTLLPPATLQAGRTGALRVRLTAAVARRLKGRTATLTIRVAVAAGGRTTTATIHPRITA